MKPYRRLLPCVLCLVACKVTVPQPDEPLAEGIFAPLGEVMPRATADQKEAFARGREVAERRFTPEEGLGPLFNVASCAACHEKPVSGGSAGHYRDFLLVRRTLADGSFVGLGTNGVQDQFALGSLQREPSPDGLNLSATRNPIPFFGVGLLAEIDEAEILLRADPEDADGDGISGRPNYDRGFVGRFGVKAQTVSIEGFIRGPLMNHLGLTSDPLSEADKARLPVPSSAPASEGDDAGTAASARGERPAVLWRAQVAAPDEPTVDADEVPDPELASDDLFDLVSFAMLLAVPEPDAPTEETRRGARYFEEVGCADCHVPSLRGPKGRVPAYSDLLLHDMGDELSDGIAMGEAKGDEFRTAPLWGVVATGPYLHDGRADTLHEAILEHGGEAEAARSAYVDLTSEQQAHLQAFLVSLGGASQASAGLLPPDAPLPGPGRFGGPARPLGDGERERFERGRAAFDRDFGLGVGLGPRFNGDSCRACHFLPVLGGAGPADVDVTRQALLGESGTLEPSAGTMAHRHGNDGKRPPIDPEAAVFERRQTPPLFGLGLIERIDAAAILAGEDPDDQDGDGVRGRARVLADDRIGRFGWKALTPTVRDFVRDALSNEVGLTLPEDGSLFGFSTDDDEVQDPEVDASLLDDLTFFTELLAPPPRGEISSDEEQRGGMLFETARCADCHTPALKTADGELVPLFSDLLLHEVGADDYLGVPDGPVLGPELRTPPLWGLRETAPYMHDASASTIEQAIAAHAGEAAASRTAFEELSAEERADLLRYLESL